MIRTGRLRAARVVLPTLATLIAVPASLNAIDTGDSDQKRGLLRIE